MIVIFGMKQGEPRPDPGGQAVTMQCPVCGQTGSFQPVKSGRFISLFFVPLIPIGASRAIQCPNCRSLFSAPRV